MYPFTTNLFLRIITFFLFFNKELYINTSLIIELQSEVFCVP